MLNSNEKFRKNLEKNDKICLNSRGGYDRIEDDLIDKIHKTKHQNAKEGE